MKKLIGATFILIALSGCDSKEANADPKYAGVDEMIEKVIKFREPVNDGVSAQLKIEGAVSDFYQRVDQIYTFDFKGPSIYSTYDTENWNKLPPTSCAKEDIIKSFGDYAGEPENKEKIDKMMIFVPFFCENGVLNNEKYKEQRLILKAYATQKFKDEYLSK
jgi:hypothetical protein